MVRVCWRSIFKSADRPNFRRHEKHDDPGCSPHHNQLAIIITSSCTFSTQPALSRLQRRRRVFGSLSSRQVFSKAHVMPSCQERDNNACIEDKELWQQTITVALQSFATIPSESISIFDTGIVLLIIWPLRYLGHFAFTLSLRP